VTRVEPHRSGVRVFTRRGVVHASTVIVATGYATPEFRPLAGRFAMHRTYVMATAPLTRRQRADIGLGPVMLWDTERPYHYARWTSDHRLLLGGEDRLVKPGASRRAAFTRATTALRAHFCRLLPALHDVSFEHAWEGLFAMTPDTLPLVGTHRRYPRHLFALGYGGNGMTFGYLAATQLLEQWRGKRSPDHDLFAFNRPRRC
ncbi:MAG TPA: FAD-binding oxidoreductase, partial [Luteitalea sp.]|nr:FAD-binding oxidoreductase [Luteitalea sp.]